MFAQAAWCEILKEDSDLWKDRGFERDDQTTSNDGKIMIMFMYVGLLPVVQCKIAKTMQESQITLVPGSHEKRPNNRPTAGVRTRRGSYAEPRVSLLRSAEIC